MKKDGIVIVVKEPVVHQLFSINPINHIDIKMLNIGPWSGVSTINKETAAVLVCVTKKWCTATT